MFPADWSASRSSRRAARPRRRRSPADRGRSGRSGGIDDAREGVVEGQHDRERRQAASRSSSPTSETVRTGRPDSAIAATCSAKRSGSTNSGPGRRSTPWYMRTSTLTSGRPSSAIRSESASAAASRSAGDLLVRARAKPPAKRFVVSEPSERACERGDVAGRKKSAASPIVSRCASRSLSARAAPHAAASTAGSPKPSASDGRTTAVAALQRHASVSSDTNPGSRTAVPDAVAGDPLADGSGRRGVGAALAARRRARGAASARPLPPQRGVGVDECLDVLVRADPAEEEEEALAGREADRRQSRRELGSAARREDRIRGLGHDPEPLGRRRRGGRVIARRAVSETVKRRRRPGCPHGA